MTFLYSNELLSCIVKWEVNTVLQAEFPLLTINQQSIPEISIYSSPDGLNESQLQKGSIRTLC
jgi:hypothetical protein